MEKFLLRALLAGDELYVVQQQQVNHAVLVAECLYVAFLDGGDQLVGEILTLYIYNAVFRMGAAQHVCNRVHQMRFTQTRVAVDEKRVVLCRRALRNRKCSRMREFVARTDDKTLKRVVVIRRSARARRGVFAGHYNDRDRVAGQVVQHLLQRSDKFGFDKFFLKGHRRVQHQPIIPKGNDRYVVKPSGNGGRREVQLFERHLQYIVCHRAPPVDNDSIL